MTMSVKVRYDSPQGCIGHCRPIDDRGSCWKKERAPLAVYDVNEEQVMPKQIDDAIGDVSHVRGPTHFRLELRHDEFRLTTCPLRTDRSAAQRAERA
jgi:hypothetical protein